MELKLIEGVLGDMLQSLDETKFEVTRAHLEDARAALMAEMEGAETEYRLRRGAKPGSVPVIVARHGR